MENMKNSGFEWIGMIPNDWNICRIKDTCSMARGGSPRPIDEYLSDNKQDISWIKIGDTVKGYKYIDKTEQNIIPIGVPKSRKVNKGDLLLTNSMSFGQPYILNIDGCIHDGWLVFSKYKNIDKLFLYYVLMSELCLIQFNSSVAGAVVENLNIDKVGNAKIFVPNLQEQRIIADFLDNKVGKTDEILADLNKQINILKDYKKSLITATVIKGLKSNVEMKASGIDWIGKIPFDWNITKLKYVSNFVNGDRGVNYPSGDDMVDEGIIFITSNNIHGTILDNSPENSKFITEERYKILGGAKIEINDIIFCLRGSVGMCAINKSELQGTVASSLVDIKPKSINPDFLNYFLQSELSRYQTNLYTNGSCAANLSAENVANYYFIEPPIQQQQEIADYLDSKCTKIDELIKDKQIQIEKMEKYKKSLIYEYVTGKKRVKGAEELYG